MNQKYFIKNNKLINNNNKLININKLINKTKIISKYHLNHQNKTNLISREAKIKSITNK